MERKTKLSVNISPEDFSGKTILIAEDIEFSFLFLEAALRRSGVRILWAQNGREAVDLALSNPDIDLVLMDIHMPVMSGLAAATLIRSVRPGLPVIAQTAFVMEEDIRKCYQAGCTGFLSKPIRRDDLIQTLSGYLTSKSAPLALASNA
jgi:two-component system, cell cycle response regulator DivK